MAFTRLLLPVLAPLALATLAGCGLTTSGEQDPILALDECRIEGIRGDARCGTLDVPENRADPKSRTLTLHFAVLPAKSRGKEPDPVFVIAGGPGQSAIAVARHIAPVFAKLQEKRDIVFLDQRGTGESNLLQCEIPDSERSPGAAFDSALQQRLIKDCLDNLTGDPRFYTTPIAMADLDQVRARLGYGQINLWGASYGTRAALEYLRRYPAQTRSVVLDGVAPQNMKLPVSFAADGYQALQGLLARCAADAACEAAYPNLRTRLDQWLARLGERHEQRSYANPVTGTHETIELEGMALRMALFRPLYVPHLASLLPGMLHDALNGRLEPLMAANYAMAGDDALDLAYGMHYAVLCSEDVAAMTDADRKALAQAFYGEAVTRAFVDACRQWPKGELPADYYEPVKSEVPVLLLSGGRDPATPPRHAEAVARYLPRSRHLIAPELGHGVSSAACAPELITRFIRAADATGIDGECLRKLPAMPLRLPMQGSTGDAR